jgi:hypothetical protein
MTPTIGAPPYGYFSPTGQQLTLFTLSDGGVANPAPGLSGGNYRYKVTYVTAGGETVASAEVGPFNNTNTHAIQLQGVPTGPVGVVWARNVYRTAAAGAAGSEVFAFQVADNTTTMVVDTLPDSGLGTAAAPARDTTGGDKAVTLKIDDNVLPVDQSGIITLSVGGKHFLGVGGTTVPEWHRDTILLGAAAYALLAYQVPTNDFFEYQDGEMRDRVDQQQIPRQWAAVGNALLGRFKGRLELIKREANAGMAAVVHWGDKPARWDRI